MPAAIVTAELAWEKRATPSQLESQNDDGSQGSSHGALSRTRQYARNIFKSYIRSATGQFTLRKQDTASLGVQTVDDDDDDETDDSAGSDDDRTDEPEPAHKVVRQQILTVPQIWLWAVEGTLSPYDKQHRPRSRLTIKQIPS